MKTPEEWAEQEWSREEYYFGYDEVWKDLVDFARDIQREAIAAEQGGFIRVGADLIAAERERCAKIAEDYDCDSPDCCAEGGGIAAKIRGA